MFNKKYKHGDKITGDFRLYLDGHHQKEYDKNTTITLGNNEYLPDLDKYIIGRKYKKVLEVEFTYSKKFDDPKFAGKTVRLVITHVNSNHIVSDDSIVEEGGVKEELAKLRAEVFLLRQQIAQKDLDILKLQTEFKEKASQLSKKADQMLQQEIQNQKQKLENERNDIKNYALQSFFEDFVIPYNNLVMAVNFGSSSTSEETRNYTIGFNIVLKQFEDVFSSNGVEIINPQLETEFDPSSQAVVDFIDSDIDNIVKKVTAYGLKLNSRLIKPASVILTKKISN
ncbi:nucleotide exchange factor GrpE [Mycoplasma sp. 6243]|uniref:nucleotide exchange factor GrpE n=1 Tax=Mycoplasma sp. 6243 TaxID=3440865 RepID=UPI003EC08081